MYCAAGKRSRRKYFIGKGFCEKLSENKLHVVTEGWESHTFAINYEENLHALFQFA